MTARTSVGNSFEQEELTPQRFGAATALLLEAGSHPAACEALRQVTFPPDFSRRVGVAG